jgi:hypothetical protein
MMGIKTARGIQALTSNQAQGHFKYNGIKNPNQKPWFQYGKQKDKKAVASNQTQNANMYRSKNSFWTQGKEQYMESRSTKDPHIDLRYKKRAVSPQKRQQA